MTRTKTWLFIIATFTMSSLHAHAGLNVVTSIKPVQGLVSAVLGEVAVPTVIVDNATSPHTFSLKPSQATALQNADVIFWIGHELETFLEKPLDALAGKATIVSLIDAPTITTLKVREDHQESHDHDGSDGHIWLDPENAKTMLNVIAATLSAADPANAATFDANRAAEIARIEHMQSEIAATLLPVKAKRFIVFHDAYQYFEKHFGLTQPAVISVHPENTPGAEKLKALRQDISDGKAQCIFAEPQFDPKLIALITEGSSVKTSVLDPLGSTTQPGPNFYSRMMQTLATAMAQCLG